MSLVRVWINIGPPLLSSGRSVSSRGPRGAFAEMGAPCSAWREVVMLVNTLPADPATLRAVSDAVESVTHFHNLRRRRGPAFRA